MRTAAIVAAVCLVFAASSAFAQCKGGPCGEGTVIGGPGAAAQGGAFEGGIVLTASPGTMKFMFARDNVTTQVERTADGKFTVTRTDGKAKAEPKNYESIDDLKKADEATFELLKPSLQAIENAAGAARNPGTFVMGGPFTMPGAPENPAAERQRLLAECEAIRKDAEVREKLLRDMASDNAKVVEEAKQKWKDLQAQEAKRQPATGPAGGATTFRLTLPLGGMPGMGMGGPGMMGMPGMGIGGLTGGMMRCPMTGQMMPMQNCPMMGQMAMGKMGAGNVGAMGQMKGCPMMGNMAATGGMQHNPMGPATHGRASAGPMNLLIPMPPGAPAPQAQAYANEFKVAENGAIEVRIVRGATTFIAKYASDEEMAKKAPAVSKLYKEFIETLK